MATTYVQATSLPLRVLFPTKMKFLAIDYGARRLGFAIADEADGLALPHGTHTRRVNDNRGDIAAILSLVRAREIGGIVMGAPAGSDSSQQTFDAAQRFAEKLELAAIEAGLKLEFHRADERYSSALAARGLRATGVSSRRAREEGLLDAGAAATLLQTFLDTRQTEDSSHNEFDRSKTTDN